MAHYAQLNQQNQVLRVVVIDNSKEPTEADGIEFCRQLFGYGIYKKTSYNANIRKNFAGIGYTYDSIRDAFIPPKPFPSWVFDETSCQWRAPVTKPEGLYQWDEITTSWVDISGE